MLKQNRQGNGCTYDAPRMELIRFTAADVIATSNSNSIKVGTYESGGGGDTTFNDIFTS